MKGIISLSKVKRQEGALRKRTGINSWTQCMIIIANIS